MNPCELTLSITAFANAFAKSLNDDELNLAAAVLMQLADTLVTISTQRALIQTCLDKRAAAKAEQTGAKQAATEETDKIEPQNKKPSDNR